jgi:hypothetical protein
MSQIVLQASPVEYGVFRKQYDALVADLKAKGYDVEIASVVEYRSTLPDPETIYNLVVRIRESPEYPLTVAALIALIQRRLRGRRLGSQPRKGKLYLPNGEQHRFELPDDD